MANPRARPRGYFARTGFLVLAAACQPDLPPAIGDTVPDSGFEVVDPGGSDLQIGTRLRLSELEGKPVVLDFWASWCGPCKRQHAYVTELKARYGDRIEVVGILFEDTPENARLWLRRNGANYPTVQEREDRLAREFWIGGIPRFVLLAPDRSLSWDMMGNWGKDSVTVRIDEMLRRADAASG